MNFPNLTKLYNEILPQAGAFLGVFFVVMLLGYGILYFIDFVPEEPTEATNETEEVEIEETDDIWASEDDYTAPEVYSNDNADPLPISITIDRLDRTITVLNPSSRSISDLDAALLKGVVRHPDSADLTDPEGNMLVLGHSSYLKNVFNKNFQAFNGIQNLTWGDTIRVRSGDTEYTYQVDRVYQDRASAITIPTRASKPKLTLATCNTYGAKEDRFIVEATLISKKAL